MEKKEQAADLLSRTKEELTGDLAEAGEGLIECLEKLNVPAQYSVNFASSV